MYSPSDAGLLEALLSGVGSRKSAFGESGDEACGSHAGSGLVSTRLVFAPSASAARIEARHGRSQEIGRVAGHGTSAGGRPVVQARRAGQGLPVPAASGGVQASRRRGSGPVRHGAAVLASGLQSRGVLPRSGPAGSCLRRAVPKASGPDAAVDLEPAQLLQVGKQESSSGEKEAKRLFQPNSGRAGGSGDLWAKVLRFFLSRKNMLPSRLRARHRGWQVQAARAWWRRPRPGPQTLKRNSRTSPSRTV